MVIKTSNHSGITVESLFIQMICHRKNNHFALTLGIAKGHARNRQATSVLLTWRWITAGDITLDMCGTYMKIYEKYGI